MMFLYDISCRFIDQTFIDFIWQNLPFISKDFMKLFIRKNVVDLFNRKIL